MSKLPEKPTVSQVREFLLEYIDKADDKESKVNSIFTRKQIWNIHMNIIKGKKDNQLYMKNHELMKIAVKNMNKEFGCQIKFIF